VFFLYYNRQVHRDFLITLYKVLRGIKYYQTVSVEHHRVVTRSREDLTAQIRQEAGQVSESVWTPRRT
jgi:hypothetical protein